MLTRLYIEALLVDEEAADAVWEAWNAVELSDCVASWGWWSILATEILESKTDLTDQDGWKIW